MTRDEAAAALDGSEYRKEGSKELFAAMKADGLVAVFGASDDLMELRGAIDDEVGAYGGGTAYLTASGLLTNYCDNDECPHFERAKKDAATVKAVWAPEGENLSWLYRTALPHATFQVNEDGEPYCRGIVFLLSDAA